jgi:transcriptional regulator with XRE-family HTH domain
MDVSTGAALRLLRIRYGLTQAALGQKLGVAPATIHTWEVRSALRAGLQERLRRCFAALERTAITLDDAQIADEVDRAYSRLLQAAEEFYRLMQRAGRTAVPHPTTLGSLFVKAGEGDSLEAIMAAAADPDEAPASVSDVAAKARRKLESELEYKRLKGIASRNVQRNAERPLIMAVHERLKPLAAAQDWDAYRLALGAAHRDCEPSQTFLEKFLMTAQGRIMTDDDPLVTLPPEQE